MAELESFDEDDPAEAVGASLDLARELLIRAKLFRALSNRDWWDADSEEVVDSDADGSAKVALIGVDRSIDAWLVLREVLPAAGASTPARTDALLDRAAELYLLRRGIEERFPGRAASSAPASTTPPRPATPTRPESSDGANPARIR